MTRPEDLSDYLARIAVQAPDSHPFSSPPWLTSGFAFETAEDFLKSATEARTANFYTRYGNPTVRAFEDAIACAEGAEAALATSSGMSALSTALLTCTPPGGRIVAQDVLYGGTEALLLQLTRMLGAELVRFPTGDTDALGHALAGGASVALFETPANPLLEITDLKLAAAACQAAGTISLVDSTIATPINQNPILLGIDLVVHSATKAIGGHGDFIAGVIAGSQARVEEIWRTAHIMGSFLDPFSAWLAIRSLRTLPMRAERLNQTAMHLAAALVEHPRVEHVYYPGLAGHGSHAVARQQMRGYGGVLSIEVEGGAAAAARLLDRFRGGRRSASFGGPATLLVQPGAMWSGLGPAPIRRLPAGLVRIGVGLEAPELLLDFLVEALA